MSNYVIPSTGGDDWELIVNRTEDLGSGDNRINQFNLEVKLQAKFLAVTVSGSNQKSNWVSAGYLSQLYDMPRFTTVPPPYYIALDRVNLIPMSTTADFEYELVYSPLKYFNDITIKIWQYTGELITPQQSATVDFEPLFTQINQIDAGIYTLADGIADLLPGDKGSEIRQQTQNRLDLDLGFL